MGDIKENVATTSEVLQCCEGIKVLGRKELKMLLTWRKKLRKEMNLTKESEEKIESEESSVKEVEMTEEEKQEELDQTISDLRAQEMKDVKKKKKRVREVH